MLTKKRRSAFLLGAMLVCTTPAAAAEYSFINIADSTGPLGAFWAPSINNNGTVLVQAALDSNLDRRLFTVSGGGVTIPIADTNGPIKNFFSESSINDAGTVAFVAEYDSGAPPAVLTGDGGPLRVISTLRGTSYGAAINNSGVVAWQNFLPTGEELRIGSGGQSLPLVDTGGPFAGVRSPHINNSGTVIFAGTFDGGVHGIFAGNGQDPPITIADSTGPFRLPSTPTMNDYGMVAFHVEFDAGGRGIIKVDAKGMMETVVDTSGAFTNLTGHAINNTGLIVFSDYGQGVFTGPDLVADKVTAVGDALFGSSLAVAFVSRGSMNDRGQIAFGYRLENGVEGIAVATPVPEPSSMALLVFGLAFIVRILVAPAPSSSELG